MEGSSSNQYTEDTFFCCYSLSLSLSLLHYPFVGQCVICLERMECAGMEEEEEGALEEEKRERIEESRSEENK